MLEKLLTEQPNPASQNIDALSPEEILRIINEEDRKVPASITPVIPEIASAVEAIVERLRAGGRLFYIGAGTSGRLGVLDAAECPPTFQVPPTMIQGIIAGGEAALARAVEAVEDNPAQGALDLAERRFSQQDALIGVAASGRTPYVLGAVAAARRLSALTIGISCTPDSELARSVEIAITPLPGPEVVTGSTRMKAGTATKLVLNMISTAVMIRLGHVFGNLMVNVQPTNTKLVDRAQRIICQAAGVESDRAGELLQAAGGNVKTAIMMARRNLTREQAERLLADCEGRVSVALAAD